MKDFRDLRVWKLSHALALDVYESTEKFPTWERYGLTSIRKSAVSIPSNIAEGCGRPGDPEFARFLAIAVGSASELEYQLLLARDLRYLDLDDYIRLGEICVEVKRMLAGLSRTIRGTEPRLRTRADR